jgi:hypothetical protein
LTEGRAGVAEWQVDSTPCFLGLGPSTFQAARAVTTLIGPGPGEVVAVTQVVASYPASAAASGFGSVNPALPACPEFALSIAGITEVVPLNVAIMPPTGNASRLYQGGFRFNRRMEDLDVALILEGRDVVGLVYVDPFPGSGDPLATIRAAVAKLA